MLLANRWVESLAAHESIIGRSADNDKPEHNRGPVHVHQFWVVIGWETTRCVRQYTSKAASGAALITYTASMVTGSTHANAMMLTANPHFPSEKRSFGIGGPVKRRQMTQKIVMVYENVRDTATSEMMALKPTTGPKLTQERAKARPTVVHTDRRGVSRSQTCACK